MGDITTHYVQQFSTNVELLLQQGGSLLRGYVGSGTHVGKQASVVDQVGEVSATQRTTRNAPITLSDIPVYRRWVFPKNFDFATAIDNADKFRMLIDPQGPYTTASVEALGRQIDDEIIAAFFADAKTGESAGTTTSFPAGNQVAVNYGASANTGLTVAKLKRALKLLLAADLDPDREPVAFAVTALQHEDLLNELQAINTDYNKIGASISNGRLRSILGMECVLTNRLAVDGSSYRRVPVWAKKGMHLGLWQDIMSTVTQRNDLAGSPHPWQVYVCGTFGATRTDEERVVEIKCSEA